MNKMTLDEWNKKYLPFPGCELTTAEAIKNYRQWPCTKCKTCLRTGMYGGWWGFIYYRTPFKHFRDWKRAKDWKRVAA